MVNWKRRGTTVLLLHTHSPTMAMATTESQLVVQPDTDRAEALSQWFNRFIERFRREVVKLSDEQRKKIPNTDDYQEPCQVEVFWLEQPEFQIIVSSRFADRPDREIIINGPFKGYEFIDRVDDVLGESRWTKPLPRTPNVVLQRQGTLARAMYNTMVNDVRTIANSVFARVDRPKDHGGTMLTRESWVGLFAGNIAETDPTERVKGIISNVILQAQISNVQPPVPAAPEQQIEATVGYVFPPITIGLPPEPKSLKEYLYGIQFSWMLNKAIECKVGSDRLVFSKDGLMALTTKNKHIAIRVFNIISALLLLEGIPAQTIRESEAGQGSLDSETLEFRSWGMSGSTPRAMLVDQRMFERLSFLQHPRVPVEPDKLSEIVERGNRILKHPDEADELILWLEANTHLQDAEYAQSFVISWIIVERNLATSWEAFLSEKNVRGDRESKLTDFNRWSTDSILETLNLAGTLPEREYKSLMELKSKRNSFVHRGRKITRDDADECMKLATGIMKHDLEGLLELQSDWSDS